MFTLDPILNQLSPVNLRDPVNRLHPLMRGRYAWWMALPGWYGGKKFYDLLGLKHATLTAMTTSTSGWRATTRPGGYGHLQFEANAYVDFPSITLTDFALAMWEKTTGDCYLLANSGSNYQIRIGESAANTMAIYDGVVNPISGTLTNARGTWRRLVFSRASGTITFYENGINKGTAATSNNIILNTMGNLTAAGWITGSMDDVSIWTRPLSAAEVKQDYELSKVGYPGVLNRLPLWSYSAPAGGGGGIVPRLVNGGLINSGLVGGGLVAA